MNIGIISGIVLVIAAVEAIRLNIRFFGRLGDPSRAPRSEFYDENLHRLFADRPGDALGPRAVRVMLLFGIALLLARFGL
jgi:hypothetical protein